MTRKEAERQAHMFRALESLGIPRDDAEALRRDSMRLRRWYELECGTENAAGSSVSVERDEATGKTFQRIQYRLRGEGWVDRREPCADRETGALRRVAAVIARYPGLSVYHQTDPRGCALYVLRPGDVPEGADPGPYYSRGIAVY
jgi:hypothetical protein